ncbi:MAG: GPW/gp25 family protein [Bacteroidetes bacterium]|nr:GPW/gp25 family protein [Bacteroidota bacterium]
MAENTGSFLGTGWSFPPSFSKANESVKMVSDTRDIEESIHLILSTIPGERVMQPEFGCDLKRLTFEIDDSTLIAAFEHLIYHALLNFEPRVNYIGTSIIDRQQLDGVLYLQINFSIITTNTRHNIVFPFYLQGEGTNVPV